LIKFAAVQTKITTCQHILVVDDNETNLAFVQVLLKNKPLKLHTATSAAQVFLLCQQQKFDMILLDIQLPDMSGVDVARQLRQLPQYQKVPIVAFTAHAMPDEIDRYRQAGMNDIIFKPLEPARLDSLLAKFCFMPA
jgi:CheY-like chemotaxis protein